MTSPPGSSQPPSPHAPEPRERSSVTPPTDSAPPDATTGTPAVSPLDAPEPPVAEATPPTIPPRPAPLSPIPSPPDAPATSGKSGILAALQTSRPFRLLWFGTIFTQLGQWMQNIALGWHMLQITDSPFWVGLIAFATGIPFLVIALPAGALVDRADERRILQISQWAAMVVAALLGAAILLDIAEPWHLLVAAALNGTIMAINQTVRQTMVPSIVTRDLMANAISLNSAGSNAMRIIGPSIAGVIIGTAGAGACFVLQALALMAALLTTTRIPQISRGNVGVASGGILDGWYEIRKQPELGSLVLLTAIPSLLVFSYIQMMPVFARDVWDIGPSGLGILMAASGLGAFSGAMTAATMGKVRRKGRAVLLLTVCYCLAITGFAVSPVFWLGMVGLFLGGFTGSIFGPLSNTLLLLLADPRIRGRVMAVYMLTNGLTPFGSIALGGLAASRGAPVAVGSACALSAVLCLICAFRMTSLRALVSSDL